MAECMITMSPKGILLSYPIIGKMPVQTCDNVLTYAVLSDI